jgi:hypothetical protein
MPDEPPSTNPPEVATHGRSRTFDSLSEQSFRWLFIASLGIFGATNSLILVRGYLVFELTGS